MFAVTIFKCHSPRHFTDKKPREASFLIHNLKLSLQYLKSLPDQDLEQLLDNSQRVNDLVNTIGLSAECVLNMETESRGRLIQKTPKIKHAQTICQQFMGSCWPPVNLSDHVELLADLDDKALLELYTYSPQIKRLVNEVGASLEVLFSLRDRERQHYFRKVESLVSLTQYYAVSFQDFIDKYDPLQRSQYLMVVEENNIYLSAKQRVDNISLSGNRLACRLFYSDSQAGLSIQNTASLKI